MFQKLTFFRKLLLLVLIPLILINGGVSAGCICKDGHLKLFCNGRSCCVGNLSAEQPTGHKCCHGSRVVASCCEQRRLREGISRSNSCATSVRSTGCCRRLALSPAMIKQATSLQLDGFVAAFDVVVAVNACPTVTNCEHHFFSVFLPPRERLKMFQRFLI